MTPAEAKKAIEDNTICEFIENPESWMTLVSLHEDNFTVYYKKFGMGLFTYATTLNKIKIG